MGSFFKIIIFLFLLFLLLKFFFKTLFPSLFKNFVRKIIFEEKSQKDFIEKEKKRKGEIIINGKSKKDFNIEINSKGEYVDFEELKD